MQFHKLLIITVLIKLNLRLAVTGYAPSHAELLYLPDAVPGLYVAMTLIALHFTCNNMLRMIEIGVIRQIVYFDPLNGLSAFDRVVYLFNFLCSGIPAASDGCVAVHTQVDWRNTGILTDGNTEYGSICNQSGYRRHEFYGKKGSAGRAHNPAGGPG